MKEYDLSTELSIHEQPLPLELIERAKSALSAATSIDSVLDIRDQSESFRTLMKQQRESLEVQNKAAELKIRAERRAGELLGEMELQKPGEYKRSHRASVCPSLGDMGITHSQSSRWQKIASLPDDDFEKHIEGTIEANRELTSSGVLKLAKKHKAATPPPVESVELGDSCVVPDLASLDGQRFGTIYADPPWQYGNQGTRASTDNHYSTMTVDELCDMDVLGVVADDAHLHLWTTNAFLFDARLVMEAWGFQYRSCFVWVKPQMGIGNYWRVSHEFMLLGIRGDAKRFNDKTLKSWAEYPRGRHSAKPDEVRGMIEAASPGPYLELFGRKSVNGWTVLGNQVEQRLFA